MNKTVRFIWNIVAWILVIVVLLVAAAVALPGVFGVKTMNVLTDSMSHLDKDNPYRDQIAAEAEVGQFLTGALIYVVPTDIEDIEALDVVTMKLGEDGFLTHRVTRTVEIDGSVKVYTMGDANSTEEGPHGQDRLVGKVVLAIPALGALLEYVQSNPIVGIIGAALLVVFLFVPDIVDTIVRLWKSDDESGDGEDGDHPAPEAETETPEAGA